jgi:universal stress protein family protein
MRNDGHGFVPPSGSRRDSNGVEHRSRSGAYAVTLVATERRDMGTSIVCGVDGSPDSHAALQVAARLADRLELRLVVAHVAEPVFVPYAGATSFGGMAGRYAIAEEVESHREACRTRCWALPAVRCWPCRPRKAALNAPRPREPTTTSSASTSSAISARRRAPTFAQTFGHLN